MAGNTLRINATDELAIDGVPDSLQLDGANLAGEMSPAPAGLGVTETVILTASARRQPVVCVLT